MQPVEDMQASFRSIAKLDQSSQQDLTNSRNYPVQKKPAKSTFTLEINDGEFDIVAPKTTGAPPQNNKGSSRYGVP